MKTFFYLFSALLFFLLSAGNADAQVLVYKIDFDHGKGINYHPFEGGYFVVPLLGGTGTFLLTSTDGARTFTTSTNGGKLFTAVARDGDKKAVISATTGSGTASGSMLATGDIDHSFSVNSPTQSLTLKVAKQLTGTALSSDDESTVTAPAFDGSIGSAGTSEILIKLDEPETRRVNDHGLSLSQAVDEIKLILERAGFASSTPTPTPTPTPTTTTTGP